jgi:hypothetical protein
MKFRKPRRNDTSEPGFEENKEAELVAAEERSITLLNKAVELHTLVTRRDQENHWQQAVDRLFSGGRA